MTITQKLSVKILGLIEKHGAITMPEATRMIYNASTGTWQYARVYNAFKFLRESDQIDMHPNRPGKFMATAKGAPNPVPSPAPIQTPEMAMIDRNIAEKTREMEAVAEQLSALERLKALKIEEQKILAFLN